MLPLGSKAWSRVLLAVLLLLQPPLVGTAQEARPSIGSAAFVAGLVAAYDSDRDRVRASADSYVHAVLAISAASGGELPAELSGTGWRAVEHIGATDAIASGILFSGPQGRSVFAFSDIGSGSAESDLSTMAEISIDDIRAIAELANAVQSGHPSTVYVGYREGGIKAQIARLVTGRPAVAFHTADLAAAMASSPPSGAAAAILRNLLLRADAAGPISFVALTGAEGQTAPTTTIIVADLLTSDAIAQQVAVLPRFHFLYAQDPEAEPERTRQHLLESLHAVWLARELGWIDWLPAESALFAAAPGDPEAPRTAPWFEQIVSGGALVGAGHGAFPTVNSPASTPRQLTHVGRDIEGACNSPVQSAEAGIVQRIIGPEDEEFAAAGGVVIVRHERTGMRDAYSLYGGVSAEPGLEVGSTVDRDQMLGALTLGPGQTSCALHFEVRHFADLFFPVWNGFSGPGDWRADAEFRSAWSDPALWMAYRDDWAYRTFAPICEGTAAERPAGLACPSRQEGSCLGEGCLTTGAVRLMSAISLYESPYSLEVTATGRSGEYFAVTDSVVFSIPCRIGPIWHSLWNEDSVRPLRAPDVFLVSSLSGDGFSYWSEGSIRHWAPNGRVSRLTALSNAPSTGCFVASADRTRWPGEWSLPQTQWVRLERQDGTGGWTRFEPARILGLDPSAPSELATEGIPDWARGLIDPSDHRSTHDPGACQALGFRLRGEEILARFLGARGTIGEGVQGDFPFVTVPTSGGVSRGQASIRTASTASAGASPVNWSHWAQDDMLCLEDNGESVCLAVYPCLGHRDIDYVAWHPDRPRQRIVLRNVSQSARMEQGLAAQWLDQRPRPPLLVAEMTRVAEQAQLRCRFAPGGVTGYVSCLGGSGIEDSIAVSLGRLAQETGTIVDVASVMSFGEVQFVSARDLLTEDSQSLHLLATDHVIDVPGLAVQGLVGQVGVDLRALGARHGSVDIDLSHWQLVYVRRDAEQRLGFYLAFDIVADCAACTARRQSVGRAVAELDLRGPETLRVVSVTANVPDAPPPTTVEEGVNRRMLAVQQALVERNYIAALSSDAISPLFHEGIRAFQHEHCLPITGEVDQDTHDALVGPSAIVYGCQGDPGALDQSSLAAFLQGTGGPAVVPAPAEPQGPPRLTAEAVRLKVIELILAQFDDKPPVRERYGPGRLDVATSIVWVEFEGTRFDCGGEGVWLAVLNNAPRRRAGSPVVIGALGIRDSDGALACTSLSDLQ